MHALKKPADAPDLRLRAGSDHHTLGRSRGDRGSAEGHTGTVSERYLLRNRSRLLLHGQGLSGQNRLLHLQAVNLNQTHIGRDLVARFEQDDIAHYKGFALNTDAFSAANNGCLQGEHLLDGIECLFGLAFLNKLYNCINNDDGKDDNRVDEMLKQRRNDRCGKQDINEYIVKFKQKAYQDVLSGRFGKTVGTVCLQALCCFFGAEARWGTVRFVKDTFAAEIMPNRVVLHPSSSHFSLSYKGISPQDTSQDYT